MKKHYLFKEISLFLVILLCFVMPSIFSTSRPETVFTAWRFPFYQIMTCVCAVFAVYIENKELLKIERRTSGFFFLMKAGTALLTFGFLCLSDGIFQLSAWALSKSGVESQITFPQNSVQVIFCLLTFLFSAAFEEFIFRIYLPEAFKNIFYLDQRKKFVKIAIGEVIPCILFALCHRYLGIFAVLNAFPAHFALRFCYKKTGNYFYGISVHFLYNILNLVMLYLANSSAS